MYHLLRFLCLHVHHIIKSVLPPTSRDGHCGVVLGFSIRESKEGLSGGISPSLTCGFLRRVRRQSEIPTSVSARRPGKNAGHDLRNFMGRTSIYVCRVRIRPVSPSSRTAGGSSAVPAGRSSSSPPWSSVSQLLIPDHPIQAGSCTACTSPLLPHK